MVQINWRSAAFIASLLLILISSHRSTISQSLTPSIHWELVNPFRFISDTSKIEELRDVYLSLPLAKRTAYDLERELQRKSEAEIDQRRSVARTNYDCDHPKNYKERAECFAPYSGWFADLANNNYAKTCWDAKRQRFRKNSSCADYIHPRFHRVRAWVDQSVLLSGILPQWSLGDRQIDNKAFNSSECSTRHQKKICVEFDLPYDRANLKLKVQLSDDVELNTQIDPIRDKLIVGLGDSYAAGEGNPDIPARFINRKSETDKIFKEQNQRVPRRDNGGKAIWLDKRCHRSMYSYQFQTALLLALKDPKEAVTFVSFSCTGGTTEDIISRKQSPGEGWSFWWRKVPSQLPRLLETLKDSNGNFRKIDFLLLSTGGNDADFAKFVANIVISEKLKATLGTAAKWAIKDPDSLEKEYLDGLLIGTETNPGNYGKLRSALFDRHELFNPDQCNKNSCARILLTVYPDLLRKDGGQLCDGHYAFDQTFGVDSKRPARIAKTDEKIAQPLRKIQIDGIKRAKLGWTVVQGHLSSYLNHGFCAGLADLDDALIPTLKDKQWTFDQRNYKTFETRPRWIKIPKDSKLASDQTRKVLGVRVDFLLEDDRSSIIHPTSEGLAKNADANIAEIEAIDQKSKKAP